MTVMLEIEVLVPLYGSSKRKNLFWKRDYMKERYSNGELTVTSVFSGEGCTDYFRLKKEPSAKVHTRMASDTLADGCNVKKPVGSTERLASLHVN